jgi:peptide/nickel transport system permease protein
MPILKRLFIRILSIAVTLIGVSIIVFVVIRVVPGNPISMMLPPGASDDDILRLKTLYGFDKSIIEQFFIWISGVLSGDFGTSIFSPWAITGYSGIVFAGLVNCMYTGWYIISFRHTTS